jgi:hypothetical protein
LTVIPVSATEITVRALGARLEEILGLLALVREEPHGASFRFGFGPAACILRSWRPLGHWR